MFKLIKKTDWTSTSGDKGTTYVVAYKGRVFTLQGEDFAKLVVDTTKKTVALNEKPVVVREKYFDAMGIEKVGLRLKPSIDLEMGEF